MSQTMRLTALFVSIIASTIWCCATPKELKIQKQSYGTSKDGQAIDLYRLTNSLGMEVCITNYGGTVVSLKVPDRDGKFDDVVLGYDKLEDYENGSSYFGATIGRYANRIAHGKFVLDGKAYQLPKNNGDNTLHGGIEGFNKRIWTAKDMSDGHAQSLQLTFFSKNGEEGFPGNLSVTVTFALSNDRDELRIDYAATTDRDTVVNLTNHSYFNLSGAGNGDILGQQLLLSAKQFTPIDADLIPTGEVRSVKGTDFDFATPTAIGARINNGSEQLKFGRGYDHNFILDREHTGSLALAARVYDPKSGRRLEISTTEPGIQLYSGNFLDGTVRGKAQKAYQYRSAFCLETQHFPDSPNHSSFPGTVLKPGQRFQSTTVYRFSAD